MRKQGVKQSKTRALFTGFSDFMFRAMLDMKRELEFQRKLNAIQNLAN